MLGASHATNMVTVNGSAADYRKGEYFQELVTVVNSSTSVWQTVSITNSGGGSATGSVFIAKTPETFGYDGDGNMTNDGRWALTWDGENRLVKMEPSGTVTVPDGAKRKLEFTYDYQGRRIQKAVSLWTNSAWSLVLSNRFVYDGWNLVAELNATNNNVIRSYIWGLDVSGSLQGAGGVGGLQMINDGANGVQFVTCDGNGNVGVLVKASDGTVSGNYEYDPFGQTIRATGVMAKNNPFRFSTKYQDDESDFLYYGYRYCNPRAGRWLSRDPIEELGGVNLYEVVRNDPVDSIDPDGRATYDFTKTTYYRTINFANGDILITADDTITVQSGNMWPFAAGGNLAKIKCLLAKLGFKVPTPKSGVYLGSFKDPSVNAWTIVYGVLGVHRVTFFKTVDINNLSTANAELSIVTMWHEMKGHNQDNGDDGSAFDTKYEAPVIEAIAKLKSQKDGCSSCSPKNGTPWAVADAFDRAMCDCEINRPPKKK